MNIRRMVLIIRNMLNIMTVLVVISMMTIMLVDANLPCSSLPANSLELTWHSLPGGIDWMLFCLAVTMSVTRCP